MKNTLVAGALALALSGCASQQPEVPFTLTLAHINDTHSHFDPSDARLILDGQPVYTRLGGFPRLLSHANALREQATLAEQPLLLVHGGGAWQGSGYFQLNQGAMNADLLSRLGLDAMVPGEQEFAVDNARLAAFIGSVDFPLLAANLDTRREPALNAATNLLPYVLYAFDGNDKERLESMEDAGSDPVVAIIGLVPEDMAGQAANGGRLAIAHEVEAAQRTVNELRAQGVKHIVALTHLGLERDRRLASRVNGIDLIVGGRSETLQGDFSDLGLGNNPPYAEQVTNPDGRAKTCVVQAGHFAQAMGRVSVTFSRDGRVTRCEGGNILLTDGVFYNDIRRGESHRLSEAGQRRLNEVVAVDPRLAVVAEDASLRRHIDEHYRPALNAAYGEVIGHVPAALEHHGLPERNGSPSQLGPLVAASQLYWANTPEVLAVTGRRADVALVGASAIHSQLEPGVLKQGHVRRELLSFATPLSLVSVTGRQLAGVLLETINAALADPQRAQAFPYLAGLRYQFDETRRGAGFLRHIEVRQEGEWVRLDPAASYNLVINAYHGSGHDGWNTLYQLQQVQTDRVDLARVGGRLTAFPVARVSKTQQGAIRVHYMKQALRCRASEVRCDTDAEAFEQYVRERRPLLTPLADAGMTLNRL